MAEAGWPAGATRSVLVAANSRMEKLAYVRFKETYWKRELRLSQNVKGSAGDVRKCRTVCVTLMSCNKFGDPLGQVHRNLQRQTGSQHRRAF